MIQKPLRKTIKKRLMANENNLSNIGVSLTEKHNLERDSNIKFTKGEEVFYHKSVDEKVLAKIVKIHYDDDEVRAPYYTIRLQDGSEKHTIYSRLKKIEYLSKWTKIIERN